ncbi:MAG: hypothetical protein AAF488_00105 [Planctomycetota bacterium]
MNGWSRVSTAALLAVAIFGALFVGEPARADDREFRRNVRSATERGRSFLMHSLGRKRRRSTDQFERAYPMGYRALVAYALIEAGTDPDGPEMKEIFDDLAKLSPKQTYGVSLYIMALDARARARDVARPIDSDRKTGSKKESLSRKERKRLETCVRWLVEAKWPERGTWGYGRWQSEQGKWEDYSNTQFAVLALEVGRRRGFELPASLFAEVVATFDENGWATGESQSLRIEGPGWWETVDDVGGTGATGVAGPVKVETGGFRVRSTPTLWGYRPGYGGPGSRGQFSMIAAATSSLIVARNAMSGQLTANGRWDLDRSIAGGILGLRKHWDELFPAPTDSIHRNYYYTLYSLEKALDLGGVVSLGSIDWYRSQSVVLIDDQDTDGGWGRKDHGAEYREVSTAFALLFLRRATRHLRVQAQGAILTGAGGSSGVEEGRVFLPSLRGTIALDELFESLEDLRTREYLGLAREALDSIPPEKLIELLGYLAAVRNGSGDAADELARDAIRSITGLDGATPKEQIVEWRDRIQEVRGLATDAKPESVPVLLGYLESASSPPMALEVMRALERTGSLEPVPALIRLLGSKESTVSKRAHDTLVALTRHRTPYPDEATDARKVELVQRWEGYWSSHGPRLQTLHTFDQLRRQLDAATTPEARARLIDAIVALGSKVLPRVDEVLAQERFAFDWLVVRERLTGDKKGF